MHADGGRWVVDKFGGGPDWPTHQFAAAVGAAKAELLGSTADTVGALKGADVRLGRVGRQITIATFAIGAEFEGHGN